MDTEKEITNNVEVEEQKVETKSDIKKEKLFKLPIIFFIFVYLTCSFVLSWYLGMKQAPGTENKKQQEQKETVKKEETKKEENKKNENKEEEKPIIIDEIKLNIDDVRGQEFIDNFIYVLHNVYIDSTDHLVPDDKRNSSDLLKDDITEFKFVYYLFERYGDKEYKKYNTNINGLHESGAYAIKYVHFKDYYEGVMGKKFNDEVIYKAGEPYRINGEYLYGKVVTKLNPNYRISSESFSQAGDKYYFTVLVEELDESGQVKLSYRVKLTISIVNEKFMLNSIVVY